MEFTSLASDAADDDEAEGTPFVVEELKPHRRGQVGSVFEAPERVVRHHRTHVHIRLLREKVGQ